MCHDWRRHWVHLALLFSKIDCLNCSRIALTLKHQLSPTSPYQKPPDTHFHGRNRLSMSRLHTKRRPQQPQTTAATAPTTAATSASPSPTPALPAPLPRADVSAAAGPAAVAVTTAVLAGTVVAPGGTVVVMYAVRAAPRREAGMALPTPAAVQRGGTARADVSGRAPGAAA